MATVELAVALPALVVVLVLALSAITSVLDQVRCVDAARATARAVARGDAAAPAVDLGRQLAPPRATFAVSGSAAVVEVSVTAPAAPALRWLGVRAEPTGHAVAAREDVAPAGGAEAGADAATGRQRSSSRIAALGAGEVPSSDIAASPVPWPPAAGEP